MTKDLTEAWKNGELKDGMYYMENTSGIIGRVGHSKAFPCYNVKQILAPVPSYEEWKIASEQLNKNGVWYTERSYKELKKEKRALEVSVGNRDNTIQELREENAKLKELLEEARDVIEWYKADCGYKDVPPESVLTKIDEVLK